MALANTYFFCGPPRAQGRVEFTVSKKADSLFPVVSAASICAKVPPLVCVCGGGAPHSPPRARTPGHAGRGALALAVQRAGFRPQGRPGVGVPGRCAHARARAASRVVVVESWHWRMHMYAFCIGAADAVTKEWLRANMDRLFGFPSLVRFSWSTCRDLLKSDGVSVKWCAASARGCGGLVLTRSLLPACAPVRVCWGVKGGRRGRRDAGAAEAELRDLRGWTEALRPRSQAGAARGRG